MEHRGEPRFPVSSPIRVIVPGDEPRTIETKLIDISGTGMRFLVPQPVDSESVVAVEVDSRLVLCEIRYCQPRGDRYVVGARRLHEIAKDAQLSDAPAVVAQMLGHLRRHIAAGSSDSQTMALEQLEQIVERSENPQIAERSENLERFEPTQIAPVPEPEPTAAQPALEAKPEPAPDPAELVESVQEKLPAAPVPRRPIVVPSPRGVNRLEAGREGVSKSVAAPVQPEATPAPEPVASPVAPPRLDPLEAARDALSSRAAEPPVSPAAGLPAHPKRLRLVIGLAASLILAALLVSFFFQHRTEAKPSEPGSALVGTAPASVLPLQPVIHHAQIRVLQPVWFSIAIDAAAPVERVAKEGDVKEFDFSNGAIFRVRDGASVELTLDGNPVGPIQAGQQILQLRPNGIELLK